MYRSDAACVLGRETADDKLVESVVQIYESAVGLLTWLEEKKVVLGTVHVRRLDYKLVESHRAICNLCRRWTDPEQECQSCQPAACQT